LVTNVPKKRGKVILPRETSRPMKGSKDIRTKKEKKVGLGGKKIKTGGVKEGPGRCGPGRGVGDGWAIGGINTRDQKFNPLNDKLGRRERDKER